MVRCLTAFFSFRFNLLVFEESGLLGRGFNWCLVKRYFFFFFFNWAASSISLDPKAVGEPFLEDRELKTPKVGEPFVETGWILGMEVDYFG